MGVDPQQPEGMPPPARVRGGGGDRPDRQTVVAADDDRRGVVCQRGRGRLIQLSAHAGNLPDVFFLREIRRACLAHRMAEVALVNHGVAEGGKPRAQLGDPERRWAHVNAAAPRTEIEWHADQLQGPCAWHRGVECAASVCGGGSRRVLTMLITF